MGDHWGVNSPYVHETFLVPSHSDPAKMGLNDRVVFSRLFQEARLYSAWTHDDENYHIILCRLLNTNQEVPIHVTFSLSLKQILISTEQVQYLLKDVEKAKAAEFEKNVLELWDRICQAWLIGLGEPASIIGPKVNSEAVFSSWNNFLGVFKKMPGLLNVNVMTDFVKENIGTVLSLLESIWVLLKGNLNLLVQFFFATISLVLGGGTVVVNFFINIIVFFSALFYLLSSSGRLYKPVELLSNYCPINGNNLGAAFEAAVNGVFKASFKMALFYGLWTWLIHNLFQVRIVYLPSVLAALLGAIPFLGTYWASLPAVLDLWLAQGKGAQAVILLIFQCLPMSFVDTTIYKEIKGGHPYMTGLAIAGGVFCMGIQGAIFGPVLLCCLLVALNMSSNLMKEPNSDPKQKS